MTAKKRQKQDRSFQCLGNVKQGKEQFCESENSVAVENRRTRKKARVRARDTANEMELKRNSIPFDINGGLRYLPSSSTTINGENGKEIKMWQQPFQQLTFSHHAFPETKLLKTVYGKSMSHHV
ncbi:unnamed protein product [Leuciscus chuanchicus]